MKIIIDLPDVDYEFIKNGSIVPIKYDNLIYEAIRSGTVLPKGHGRLIDADTLDTHCGRHAIDCAGDCDRCSDNVVKVEDIHRAPTIISADNSEVN